MPFYKRAQPPAEGLRVTLERGATYRIRFVTKGTAEPIEGVEAMIQTGGGGTIGVSSSARPKNDAIWSRRTASVGQKLVLSGGLQPRVIPLRRSHVIGAARTSPAATSAAWRWRAR